jgi:hypothetical protein
VSTKFVEFTEAGTLTPVWVNPDYVRNLKPLPGHDGWVMLAMGGEGQDVTVKGDLKAVLETLKGTERLSSGDSGRPRIIQVPEPTPGARK